MPIFNCTQCGYKKNVKPELAGKKAACPKCKTVARVSTSAPPNLPKAPRRKKSSAVPPPNKEIDARGDSSTISTSIETKLTQIAEREDELQELKQNEGLYGGCAVVAVAGILLFFSLCSVWWIGTALVVFLIANIVGLTLLAQISEREKKAKSIHQDIRRLEAEIRAETLDASYREALRLLEARPSDPALRRQALECGRELAAFCREDGSETVFDELALKNDLDAATASVNLDSAAPRRHSVGNRDQPSVENRLRKILELRDAGLITDSEYEARRGSILDSL